VHILAYDEDGDACSRLAVEAGYGRVTALVPAPDGGFLVATETPGIVRTGAGGKRVWEQSFVDREPRDGGRLPARSCRGSIRRGVGGSGRLLLRRRNPALAGLARYRGRHRVSSNLPDVGRRRARLLGGTQCLCRGHFETYLQATRLDENGTVLWKREFGSVGLDELLGVRETASGRFAVLYRSTTFPENFWGGVETVRRGCLFTLDENGDMTDYRTVEDDGGVVVASSGGYLSIVATDAGIALVGRDAAGSEVWRQEQAIEIDLYSIRGIGTETAATSSPGARSHEDPVACGSASSRGGGVALGRALYVPPGYETIELRYRSGPPGGTVQPPGPRNLGGNVATRSRSRTRRRRGRCSI
jgi:hypothetical protein